MATEVAPFTQRAALQEGEFLYFFSYTFFFMFFLFLLWATQYDGFQRNPLAQLEGCC